MKSYRRYLTALVAATLTAFGGLALAQDEHGQEAAGHGHEKAQVHGGSAAMTQEFHFETVFTPDEIRLYVYDGKQNPMMAKHWKQGLITGSVTVSFQDRTKDAIEVELKHGMPSVGGGEENASQHSEHEQASSEEHQHGAVQETHAESATVLWACPMHPGQNGTSKAVCDECGMAYAPQDYLIAKIDLSGIEAGEAKAVFKLTNLAGTQETDVTFTQKVAFASAGGEGHADEHGHDDDHDHGDDHDDSDDHDHDEH